MVKNTPNMDLSDREEERDETDQNDSYKSCSMRETDETGKPNLCCCYVADTYGDYQDPCFYPADECC